jgi:PTS system galactitol-specific IIA component
MKLDKKLFSEQVLLFHQDLKTQDEVFEDLNKKLLAKGVVNDEFLDAVKKREIKFPTGLQQESGFGVAIPHTDPQFVNKNQIGFMSLDNPIQFRQMGSDTEKVQVKMVFILCLKEAHKQLDMLQNLMTLFGDSKQIEQLYKCKSPDEFLKIIC